MSFSEYANSAQAGRGTDNDFYIAGAKDIRKRNFDRCPNCGVHSDTLIVELKIWDCENENCRVAYFDHE